MTRNSISIRKVHRRTALLSLAVCAIIPAMVFPLSARTIPVPSSEAESIPFAMIKASKGDTVLVEDGVYKGHFFVEPGVVLAARHQYYAILDGKGTGNVLTLGRGSGVTGMEIRNGTFGVVSKGEHNAIRNCRIVKNYQTGIVSVRHVPLVENNVIAFNGGSGIQTWDARTGEGAAISHNVIAYNENHGIAIGGKSGTSIQYNIIAFNNSFGVKTPTEGEKITIEGNNLFGNLWTTTPLPSGNLSYDPQFAGSPHMDFNSLETGCPECPKDKVPGLSNNRAGNFSASE